MAFQLGSTLHQERKLDGQLETLYDAFTRRGTQWGADPMIARLYYSGPVQWPTVGLDPVQKNAAPAVASFKIYRSGVVDHAGVTAGRYDTLLRNMFLACPINGTVHRWAYWHEVEDDIERGDFTYTAWQEAEDHVRIIADEFDGTGRKLRRGQISMGWTFNPKSSRDLHKFATKVAPDYLGIDFYPTVALSDISAGMKFCTDYASSVGITEVMATEFGQKAPPKDAAENAQFLKDFAAESVKQGLSGAIYYDAVDPGNSSDYRLKSDVEHQSMGSLIKSFDPHQ